MNLIASPSLLLLQQVALKTLIVIHRLLREGDPTFREELLNFSQRARILQLSNFKDDSSPIGESSTQRFTYQKRFLLSVNANLAFLFVSLIAWDCSAWVRTYALFLEERLECFRVLKYDTEAERLPKSTPGQDKVSTICFASSFVLRVDLSF